MVAVVVVVVVVEVDVDVDKTELPEKNMKFSINHINSCVQNLERRRSNYIKFNLLDEEVEVGVSSIEELNQQAADVVTQRVVGAKTVVNSVTVTFTVIVTL